jgi:hypothetical protein
VREVAVDRGFNAGPTNTALEDLHPTNVFIVGRQEPGSKRTQRRLRRYRTGSESRISHLKRRYGLDRSRLKGDEGRQIWTEWAIVWPTTPTRSPSGSGETLERLTGSEQTHSLRTGRARPLRGRFVLTSFPWQVS